MYAILLSSHGEERVKCQDCGGEGTLDIHDSLKTCRECGGMGKVPLIDEIHRVMRRFQLPEKYSVSRSQGVLLKFRVHDNYDVDTVIHTAQALSVSGMRCRIIFPILG